MSFRVLSTLLIGVFAGCSVLHSQIMTNEIVYTQAFLDTKNLGTMSKPNIFELGIGVQSTKYPNIYGYLTAGYISFDDLKEFDEGKRFKYQSVLVGGKIGIRPFTTIFYGRFQPIMQIGAKTTVAINTGAKDGTEKQQLFSNGITKDYVPAKILFVTGSAGIECYVAKRTALLFLGNYDYTVISNSKFTNFSGSAGIKFFY